MQKRRIMANKKRAVITFAAVVASTGLALSFSSPADAASTYTLKDYSELGSVPSGYDHSRVYFTENTRIYVKEADSSSYGSAITPAMIKNSTSSGYVYQTWQTNDAGKSVQIKVTGSTATDNSGNPVDVVYTISNMTPAPDGTCSVGDPQVALSLSRGAPGIKTQDGALVDDYSDSKFTKVGDPGTPVIVGARAVCASGRFLAQFYKAGTNQIATVNKIAVFSYDYDATGYQVVDGNTIQESATPLPIDGTSTTYYYDKSSSSEITVSSSNGMIAYNGSERNPAHDGGSFNAPYYKDSALALIDYGYTIGGEYGFNYSAKSAHIELFFGTVNATSTPEEEAPVKHVVKLDQTINRATGGDTYKYIVTQKIPDVFRPDLNIFSSLRSKYRNIAPDYSYNLFGISDKLDASLFDLSKEIPAKVYLGDEDVTSGFEIMLGEDGDYYVVIDGLSNKLIKSAKFYNKTLRVEFDVTVSPTIAVGVIKNTAETFAFRNNSSNFNASSNEVTTNIYHTLTIRHINKDNGQELVDTLTTEHEHGHEYTTLKLEGLPGKLHLIETPANASGIINSNTVVTYYYSAVENPKTFDINLIPFIAAFVGAGGIGGAIFFAVSKRR